MRIAERVLWAITGLAVVMKLLHLPLANFLLIIGASTLMLLYFFLSWLLLPSPTRKHQVLGVSLLAGVALTFMLEGILFKLQAWPLASFNTLVGLSFGSIAILVLWLITRSRPDLRDYRRAVLWRVVPLMLCGTFLYPVTAHDMILFHHRDAVPEIRELYDHLYSTDNPEERETLRQRIDSLEQAAFRGQPGIP
ncbi:MAG: hypothetical protein IPL52_12775 [Flavobacteriales bacterium]|nr:hypothetical protein [Flavobacteriales bacterium]